MSYYGNIYREPPQPTQGRRFVPIPSPPAVDNPPPRSNALAMVAIMVCWQAVVPQPIYQNVLTEPGAAPSAEAPPNRRQPESVRQAWEPPYRQIPRAPKLTPVPPAVDNPPPLVRGPPQFYDTYHPEQRRTTTPIVAEVAPGDTVPFKPLPASILDSWHHPGIENLWATGLTESVTYTPDEPPPLRRQALPVYEVPHPQQRRTTTPIVAEAAVVDDPPPKSWGPLQQAALAAWTDVQTVRITLAVAPVPAVDEPPPLSRIALYGILGTHWDVPPAIPQRQEKVVQGAAPPVVDNPPPLRRAISYQPSEQQPQQPRATFPHEVVVTAEQPAFKRQPQSIIDSWQRPADYSQRPVVLVPIPPVVNDPPPRSLALLLAIIREQWEPWPPLPHRPVMNTPPTGVAITIIGTWSNVIEARAGGVIYAYSGGHIEAKAGGRIEANA